MNNPLLAGVKWLGDRFQSNYHTVATMVGGAYGYRSPMQRLAKKFWEVYATNEVVFAATQESVRSSSTIPFLVEKFEMGRWAAQPPMNEIAERLEYPNDDEDGLTLRERADTELIVTGNSIVAEFPTSGTGLGEFRALPSMNVWLKRHPKTHRITEYIYDPKNQHHGGPNIGVLNNPSKDAIRFKPNRIIHRMYAPDPWQMDWGLGPIAAALDAIDADINITFYIREFFRRGAVTPHIFISEVPIRDEQGRQMQRNWERNIGGVGNAWKLGWLDGSKGRIEKLGSAPGSREVGLEGLRQSTEVRILMALNVPPIVVGASMGIEHMTYSNYTQARVAMFEENTEPLVLKRDASYTHYFRQRTGSPLIRVRGDFTGVLAVQQRMDERSERETRELQSGLKMRNEARSALGLPPSADGDVFYIPLNLETQAGSVVTQANVTALAQALGDRDRTLTVLRHQALDSALTFNITRLPDEVVQNVMVGLPPRGEASKVQYARRALMSVHVSVRQWAESEGGIA